MTEGSLNIFDWLICLDIKTFFRSFHLFHLSTRLTRFARWQLKSVYVICATLICRKQAIPYQGILSRDKFSSVYRTLELMLLYTVGDFLSVSPFFAKTSGNETKGIWRVAWDSVIGFELWNKTDSLWLLVSLLCFSLHLSSLCLSRRMLSISSAWLG